MGPGFFVNGGKHKSVIIFSVHVLGLVKKRLKAREGGRERERHGPNHVEIEAGLQYKIALHNCTTKLHYKTALQNRTTKPHYKTAIQNCNIRIPKGGAGLPVFAQESKTPLKQQLRALSGFQTQAPSKSRCPLL